MEEWKKYHKDLYTPIDNPAFDNDFKIFVETKLEEYAHKSLINLDYLLEKPFELQQVADVCKELPSGKAGYSGQQINEALVRILIAYENWNITLMPGRLDSLYPRALEAASDEMFGHPKFLDSRCTK